MKLSRQGRLQLSLLRTLSSAKRYTQQWKGRPGSSEPLIQSTTSSTLVENLSKKLKAISNGQVPKSSDANAVTEILKAGPWSSSDGKTTKKKKKKKATEPQSGSSGWSGESWKEDWGEDKGLMEDIPKTVLHNLTPPTKQNPIATLHHGLERVLFNPGVHWLRDPRSRVYNFPPALGIVPKVEEFAFERLTGFIRSSRDEDLWALAKQEKRKFGGSTSSLSGMLCHIYFLLSGNKTVDTSTLSLDFRRESSAFTPGQRMAASVIFNYRDGVYSIDSGSSTEEDTNKNILLWMGTILEKYLTMPSDEFLTYLRSNLAPPEKITEESTREAYRYSKASFL
ncbi:mitochondrial protein Pet127-domain-containing protein [Lentinula aciculospora]|uniref:Mitochondrial protein Pet127-domain-containing protein n=1 Tax=Lentinula aciculospora TaxID=153920 RepID=A0A9W9AI83_9AGAR|nr:mitochondrial protein Pet127-domain-containing protein [Lentinula aciculospora]